MVWNTLAPRIRCVFAGGLMLAALSMAGCDLGVQNPGPIEDSALDDSTALAPLVIGMGADLSAVLDNVAYFMGIASRDIWHTGAFEPEFFMQDGSIEPRHVNGLWGDMHGARWVAENGVERIRTVLGDAAEQTPLLTEAYTWAGYANRLLGENVCDAVIDGGASQPHTVHFERAEEQFTEALRLAEEQGESELRLIALAGRAQARADQGNWADAAADASQIPDDFIWQAKYSINSDREWNWLYNESHIRAYFSVYGTFAATANDPRTPWEDMEATGVDGRSPYYRQSKVTSYDTDLDLAAGDEMRLIEAEAALRANDLPLALGLINHVRAAAGVETVTAATVDEGFAALRHEREIILWMEARRLWDLRRFEDPFLADRDACLPISQNEAATNPNIGG